MGIIFNADEIFEIAEQIERNGVKYYNRAAELTTDSGISEKLIDLAKMEQTHVKTFADMRAGLSEKDRTETVYDPDNQSVLYLRALGDLKVFDMEADPSAELTGTEGIESILNKAIDLEKESIIFYLGMKDMIPENLGKEKIESIIKEEMVHITLLNGQLRTLK